jgi:hypothetical protein
MKKPRLGSRGFVGDQPGGEGLTTAGGFQQNGEPGNRFQQKSEGR